jgi:integrase
MYMNTQIINCIEMPKSLKEDKDVVALTITEQNKLEDYLETHTSNYKNIILLCLYTGMRIGEVLALNYDDDIDLDNKNKNINKR